MESVVASHSCAAGQRAASAKQLFHPELASGPFICINDGISSLTIIKVLIHLQTASSVLGTIILRAAGKIFPTMLFTFPKYSPSTWKCALCFEWIFRDDV